jgi:uncharacterized protein (TIGR03083 family)
MTASDRWKLIHAEREALASDLASLTDDQWRTPSLCGRWTAQEVLAHMTATAQMTPPKFVAKMARAGFRFNDMTARDVAAGTAGTPQHGLDAFRSAMASTSSPPGPGDTWLGETIIHAEDIRRPLGITHAYPTEAVVRVADFYKNSNALIGAKNRIAGLSLRATDTQWSTGQGPEVSGPILSLLMAMTGRKAALADLKGEGVETLQSRMP